MTGNDPAGDNQPLGDRALHEMDQTAVLLTITDQFLRTSDPVVIDKLRDWLAEHYPTINLGWLIDMISFEAARRRDRDPGPAQRGIPPLPARP
jgi:hypothetical protein